MKKKGENTVFWLAARLFPGFGHKAEKVTTVRNGEVAVLATTIQNASISYLIAPHMAAQAQRFSLFDTSTKPPGEFAASNYSAAVIVRYLPEAWVTPEKRFHANGGKLIYFMDDDLMDAQAQVGLPRDYAKKIQKLATARRPLLEKLCSEFWVSSDYLANNYSSWQPKIIKPSASAADLAQHSRVSVCYHGTASHKAELEWLAPIIKSIHSGHLNLCFEVSGDHSVNRLYRDIPRVAIFHPMSWPNYLDHTSSSRHDIALAPLLAGAFNAGRGPTKFFDFARMGAVGIYTDIAPYRGFIRHGVDGLLLANDPQLWARTITELANDAPRRGQMASLARERALSMVAGNAICPEPDGLQNRSKV